MKQGYYQSPTVCGQQVVFVCEDNLWQVALSGGVAKRLSSAKGAIGSPVFSANGKFIACVAREEGTQDVYVLPKEGGQLQRLTYLGTVVQIASWSKNKIIFSSTHESAYGRANAELYAVSLEGGAIEKLPLGHAYFFNEFEHEGMVGRLLGRNEISNSSWKHYLGGMRGEIWVALGDAPFQKICATLEGHAVAPLYAHGRIYFLYDDAENIGQVCSCQVDGSDFRTETTQPQFYARHLKGDGRTLVYQSGGRLFAIDLKSGKEHQIQIDWHPSPVVMRSFFDGMDYIEDLSLNHSGQMIAATCRGKLFATHIWQGAAPQAGQLQGVRYRLPRWLSNDFLAVLSDEPQHTEELHIFNQPHASPQKRIALPQGRVQEMVASPSKLALVATTNRLELYLIEVSKKQYRFLDSSQFKEIEDVTFSPDGKWIAYSKYITLERSAIFLLHLDEVDAQPIQATHPIRKDYSPSFDLKGKYLYFLSQRHYQPVIEETHFNASFPCAIKPYLISLQADSPNPLKQPAPIPGIKDDEDDESENETKKVIVDAEGLQHRIAEMPIHAGNFVQLVAISGRVLLIEYPQTHEAVQNEQDLQGTLWVYNFQKNTYEIASEDVNALEVTPSGQTALYFYDEGVRVVEAGIVENDTIAPPLSVKDYGHKEGWVNLERFRITIDFQQEWQQMFQEAWRLQKEFFYKSTPPHLDWEEIYQRYSALLPYIQTRSELSDLIWEMQGELGTSHAYESGGSYEPVPYFSLGKLAADWAYDTKRKKYVIHQICRGDVWNPNEHSPLAELGVDAKEGDAIVKVNSIPVKKNTPPEQLLIDQAKQHVALTLERDGKQHDVVVQTLSCERRIRYRQWVNQNQKLVDELSQGKLGYVHIPDMQRRGVAEFFRAYLVQIQKEGLIIDIRYNEGGMTSSIILEKLSNRRLGYDVPRWGSPDVYPTYTHKGTLTLLVNEFTGSDGDMFAHSFQQLRLGHVIGKQTWGGVVGIDCRYRLVDRTLVTQPQYAAWFYQGEWSIENQGVSPDTVIEMTPEDMANRHDAQLEYAIKMTLNDVKARPDEPIWSEPDDFK